MQRERQHCYTTVPIFRIDEQAKTATLIFHDIFPPKQYSMWGGGVEFLANGDLQIDLCHQGKASNIYEVTQSADPKVVWHMHVAATMYIARNGYPASTLGCNGRTEDSRKRGRRELMLSLRPMPVLPFSALRKTSSCCAGTTTSSPIRQVRG